MKPLFYSLLCAATMFVSCTKDQEFEVLSNSEPKTLSNSKETKSSIEVLEFATEADFLKAVESPAAILNYLSDYSSFESLYDEFEKAWLVEEDYYVSDQKYNEFKKLFPHLYFPEYKDDYSFFLPVSNDSVAKLLSPEGYVKIAEKMVNYIDIKTPQDLLRLGRLAPDNVILTRANFVNNIPEQMGSENDRKLWVNTEAGFAANGQAFTKININFRKKAGLRGKWKNYKSEVSIVGTLRYATGQGLVFPVTSVKRGKAPISYEFLSSSPFGVYPFPCRGKNIEIWYQGIGHKFHMDVDISPK